ncbi:MAG: alkaline phosphatase family protein [Chloroflexi bacterium]|nr:alkaline phosphatase family protein [Chloroflexota bacterium]
MSEASTRVLIIGLDAATFDLIEPWAAQGYLPNMAKLMAEGARGRLASTIQPTTAPAWVTFMTGMNQGKHGLYDFVRRKPGKYSLDVTNSSHIAAPLMFETLSRLGRRVISINVPYSYPPRPVNGIMIGGPFAPAVTRELVYPPEMFDTLREIAPDYFVIPDYDANVADPMSDYAAKLRREVELREQVSLALIEREAWDVFAVVIMATDEVQHTFWQCMESDDNSPLAKYRNVIRDIYQRCDAAIGNLIEAARKNGQPTDVIILSDHGAGRFDWMINLNRWLADQGLLRFQTTQVSTLKRLRAGVMQKAARAYRYYVPARLRMALRNRLGSKRFSQVQEEFQSALITSTVDWAQTQAYSLGAGGNIYVNLQGREQAGPVSPAEYETVRQRIIDGLATLCDPDTGAPMVKKAFRREELYHGPQLDNAPDVIIQWTHYGYWGRGYYGSQQPVFERQRQFDFSAQPLTGSHRPEGILLAHGPHIQPGAQVVGARLMDLAPTIFQLLGHTPPAEMDGRVLSEALIGVATDTAASTNLSPAPEPFDYTQEEADIISEHLRALGYL